ANSSGMTRTGTLKGKVAYMPPEQLRGDALDRRADVFALGVVLYEMLGGKRPWEGDSEVSLIGRIMTEDPQPLSVPRPEAPAALGGAAGYAFLQRRGAFAADVVPIERASVAPRPAEPVAEPATPQVQAAEPLPSEAPAAAADAGAAPEPPTVIAQAAPAVAPAAVPPAPVPPALPIPPAAQSPQIVKPKRTVPPAAPQPAVQAKGELVLLIRPWARVEVDGQEIGVTPLNEPLMLAAGEHTVRLVNPDLGKDITRTVQITASGREVLKELLDE